MYLALPRGLVVRGAWGLLRAAWEVLGGAWGFLGDCLVWFCRVFGERVLGLFFLGCFVVLGGTWGLGILT